MLSNMKIIVTLCAVITVVVSLPEDIYDLEFDESDIKQLLENPRTLKNYAKCFLDKGPCTPDGIEFKKAIPEALKTVCGKCSRKQRHLIRVVVHAYMSKQPELWNELVDKLDPSGDYTNAFDSFLSSNE